MTMKNAIPRSSFELDDMPLDAARSAFQWLLTGPAPLSVDGRRFRGLPERPVPLDELLQRLLDRRCRQPLRDAVWAHLIGRSREQGGKWTVGCVGMALPALTTICARLTARFVGDPRDIHAATLTGFLAELTHIDLTRPRIMLRLRWAAYRAGHECLRESLDAPTPSEEAFHSSAPQPPCGHPDLVLLRAVAERAITAAEADLIGSTRLEDTALAEAARARGSSYEATKKARQRAEHRLAQYLSDRAGELAGHAPDHPPIEVLDRLTLRDRAHTAAATPADLSPTVIDLGGRRRRIRRRVSPDSAQSGVQGCGGTPAAASPASPLDRPDTASGPTPEVPRCA
jgi:hypothetical protein